MATAFAPQDGREKRKPGLIRIGEGLCASTAGGDPATGAIIEDRGPCSGSDGHRDNWAETPDGLIPFAFMPIAPHQGIDTSHIWAAERNATLAAARQ